MWVRQGPLIHQSRAGTALILGLQLGSGRDQCYLELAVGLVPLLLVEVRRGRGEGEEGVRRRNRANMRSNNLHPTGGRGKQVWSCLLLWKHQSYTQSQSYSIIRCQHHTVTDCIWNQTLDSQLFSARMMNPMSVVLPHCNNRKRIGCCE